MLYNSGKFDNTIKERIHTKYGTVLKVTHYPADEPSFIEYKIRPKCAICGGNAPCMCFSDDNSDDPLEDAIEGLQKEAVCENPHCICKVFKRVRPEEYEKLYKKYGSDVWSICEKLQEKYYTEDDDGLFCEV